MGSNRATRSTNEERRSSVREKVSVPAKLAFNGRLADITVVDLSEGGFAARTPELLTVGACVGVELSLPGSSEPVQCNGIVAWAIKDMAGVEFSFITEGSATMIDQWLDHHVPSRGKVGKPS